MPKESRFTIRETRTGFVLMDGGHTMEPLEVEAARLNLLGRIAGALERVALAMEIAEERARAVRS